MNFNNFINLFEQEQNPPPGWLSQSSVKALVYHGTDKPVFNQFQYQKSTRAILFSTFEVEAKGFFFAENPHDALIYGKNVAACYVNLKNPLVDPRRDRHLGIDGFDRQKEMHILKILGPLVQRDPKHGPFIDIGVRRVWLQNRNHSFAHEWIYEVIGNDGVDWDILDNPQVIDRMKKLGYDGTFVQEPESHLGRSIFVVSPDQIFVSRWLKNVRETPQEWGDKDDWYTRKIDGKAQLFSPMSPKV